MIKPTPPAMSAGFTSQGNSYFRYTGQKGVASKELTAEKLISEAIGNVVEAAKSGSVREQQEAAKTLQELVFTLMREGTQEDLIAVKDRSKEIKEALNRVKTEIPDVDLYGKDAEISKASRLGGTLSVDV